MINIIISVKDVTYVRISKRTYERLVKRGFITHTTIKHNYYFVDIATSELINKGVI